MSPGLGVNIDHVATLRQARGGHEPEPLAAALLAQSAGAHGITVHLRADRRHIQERDVRLLKDVLAVPLNVECAATPESVATVVAHQPRWKLPGLINQHGVAVGQVRLGSAGMAELEAMACGRPVITWFNELHAYSEVPPYVTAVDGVEVASAIKNLVDQPEMRDLLGARGRDWVARHHGLDPVVDRVEAVARAIVDGEPIPAAVAAA